MKKLHLILASAAAIAFAACTSDAIVNVEKSQPGAEDAPITFSSYSGATTRADIVGAEAAALLGGKFVVTGYKGNASATVGNVVFDNYAVTWADGSAYSSQSNTTNWEYVGVARTQPAIDNGITSQAIKYWDYSKPQYDFIAWSTGTKEAIFTGTPTADQVLVSAITPSTATGATGKAYTFTGTKDALASCYIADMVTVKKANYGSNPVRFKFRSLGTKVRVAFYETIPGYSVKDVKFYTDAATAISDGITETSATLFAATEGIYTGGTYTVYFPTVDDESNNDNNQAHVKFTPEGTQSTTSSFGTVNYTAAKEEGEKNATQFLGRTSATASYAGNSSTHYYSVFMPNETGNDLTLRVNYTLESIDGSGEEITVHGALAVVPSTFATWKSNFAYTYIFKISDNTNGWTSTLTTDAAGLYPITFDAVVVDTEEFTQSTITTVATPSITAYQKGHNVAADEYAAGDIYVQVMGDGALKSDLATKGQLYSLSRVATEAEVSGALLHQTAADATTITGKNGIVLTKVASDAAITAIPGEDGNDITVTAGTAAKFAATTNTYAYVYTVSTSPDVYGIKVIKVQ